MALLTQDGAQHYYNNQLIAHAEKCIRSIFLKDPYSGHKTFLDAVQYCRFCTTWSIINKQTNALTHKKGQGQIYNRVMQMKPKVNHSA